MPIVRRILSGLSSAAAEFFRDGLDTAEYEMRVEREFRITLPNEEKRKLKTLGDLCRLIADQQRHEGFLPNEQEIWNRVRIITSEEIGINPAQLHPGVRFVEDLCF